MTPINETHSNGCPFVGADFEWPAAKIALVALGIILIIGSMVAIGLLHEHIGNLAFTALSLAALGIVSLALVTLIKEKKEEIAAGEVVAETTPEPYCEAPLKTLTEKKTVAEEVLRRTKLDLYSYAPLRSLIERRDLEFRLPGFYNPTEYSLVKPQGNPFLDELKEKIEPLKLPLTALNPKHCEIYKQSFITTLKGYFGQVAHPSQIEGILEFCKNRISQFNATLAPSKIDSEEFCEPLNALISPWNMLLEVAAEPKLVGKDLDKLEKCCQIFTTFEGTFYADYLQLFEKLQDLVKSIGTKPCFADEPRKQIVQIQNHLIASLKVHFSPPTPTGILNTYIQLFQSSLSFDILELFQQKEVKFSPGDLDQIFDYFRKEIEKLNKIVAGFANMHALKIVSIRAIEHFEDINPLMDCWKMMREMLVQVKIDDKITFLECIAHNLPEKDSEVWTKYPLIKEAMGDTLTPLFLSYFSEQQLDVIKDRDLIATIETAFIQMATKLGCETPKKPQMDMEVGSDAAVTDSLRDEALDEAIQQINVIYYNNLQFGPRFASEQTAQQINRFLTHYGTLKFEMARRVLERMPSDSARNIQPYLEQILY